VVAFRAPEEPNLAFVCSPQLAKPPDGEVVLAFRALDLDGGHGFEFDIFIIHNRDLVLGAHLLGLHLISGFNLTNIPAFPALELTPRRDHHRLTFRTEHRYSMREQRRLTLVSGTPLFPVFFFAGIHFNAPVTNFFVLREQNNSVPSESFFW
jgi:hypothetical protein